MSKYKKAIREVLKKYPDGLNAATIGMLIEAKHSTSVITALHDMGEAYIDRWERRRTGQLAAVWCLADVPEHCPRPDVTERHARRVALRFVDGTQSRNPNGTKPGTAGSRCTA